ncbi:MAG: outer membrane beta-barrel protein [Pseudomonadota bacterium]|uniref:outer membrane protein n=1 Tax=Roseixanthobacter finlandensis TaxID=3119922 RepID=UPI003727D209
MMPLPSPRSAFLALAMGLLTCASLATASRAADLPPGFLGKAGDFTLNAPEVEDDAPSGWYFRADTGTSSASAATRAGALAFPVSSEGEAWTLGGGIGYRLLPFLRADFTMDYMAPFNAAASGGAVRVAATTALASAYWDIATWNGLTPYVGGGLGFGIVSLERDPFLAVGGIHTQDWRFTWELAAGVSWAITPGLSLDFGYRYLAIDMPGVVAQPSTPVVQEIDAHQFRIGVRYALK